MKQEIKISKNMYDARAALRGWKDLRKHKIEPVSNCLVYKPTFELEYFKESVLYRFIELADATFYLLDVDNFLGAVVTVRGLQETFSVMWYINELCLYAVKHKELKHFNDQIKRLMLGSRDDKEFPKLINVLTLIDKVEKLLPGYRKHYDILSEYVHPNWHGTMGLFGKTGGKDLKVEFGRYIRGKKTIVKHIEIALINSIDLLSYLQNEYEDIVKKVADICHDVYEKGELKNQIFPNQTEST